MQAHRRPAPAGDGRVPGRGLWPPGWKGQRDALAGAMAFARERAGNADCTGPPLRAGPGNATRVSPACAGRCPADRQVREGQRPAPAGGGSGAGRGLWPPAGQGSAWRCGRGDGPCHGSGETAFVSAGGTRKRDPRFPARARRCPLDRRVQSHRQASARPGGSEAPAGGGSGAGRGLWPPAGQGSARRCGRGDGPCH